MPSLRLAAITLESFTKASSDMPPARDVSEDEPTFTTMRFTCGRDDRVFMARLAVIDSFGLSCRHEEHSWFVRLGPRPSGSGLMPLRLAG
ncbi:hypothetical protein GCM10009611_10150 [Arthrobacter roseus]